MKTIIFDIDNTLADNTHRLHYIINSDNKKDYGSFYENLINDKPIQNVIDLCNTLAKSYNIILLTGRPEQYRKLTTEWLDKHKVDYSFLFMRKQGDYRTDDVVKKEYYMELLKDSFEIIGIFEDRNRCVKMWRDLGLTCYQPKETE